MCPGVTSNRMKTFTLENLGALIGNEWEAYLPFHERRADGLWVKPLDAVEKRIGLSIAEKRIRSSHPTSEASSVPALGVTFTLAEFLAFAQQPNVFLEEAIGEDHLQDLRTSDRVAYELGAALTAGEEVVQSAAASAVRTVPIQRQVAQEARLLEIIKDLGHEPTKLPKTPGKNGVKKSAWDAAAKEARIFTSRQAFDKAWERLRSAGSIADA
jgi:hypothetical protein